MGPLCFQGSNDGLTTDIKGNKAMSFINRSHKNSWVGSRCTGRQRGKARLSRVTCSISDSVSVQCFTGILSSQLPTGWYFFSKTLLITSFFFFANRSCSIFAIEFFWAVFFSVSICLLACYWKAPSIYGSWLTFITCFQWKSYTEILAKWLNNALEVTFFPSWFVS